jgi:ATP-dependent Lon protease
MEKMSIAQKYLVPKMRKDNGIEDVDIDWPEAATRTIVQLYTREAGVRTLEREIASVCRKIAKEVVKQGKDTKFKLNPGRIKKYLGVPKYRSSKREEVSEIGMTTGLAWTQMGGEILQIEVTIMPGKGKLMITGKLGDVMQESAQAAMSYVRSRANSWGLTPDFYAAIDIHIHVPEGAMPKDGPSAGITMATALVSALTKIPVRHDVAMTGEITLRGRVLPIGGFKEKALAAHRAGIRLVILPKENDKDLDEIPKSVARVLKFAPVEHMDEVLKYALDLNESDEFFVRSTRGAEKPGGGSPGASNNDDETRANPAPTGEVQEH